MSERSAFREPMVWLIVGLPAASVVAGLLLLTSAVRSGGADEVNDQVQRTAQIQQSELGPDARAASMKLSAVLSLGEGTVDLLPASGEFSRDRALVLSLSHPVDASQDRRLILQPSKLGWHAAVDIPVGHDWILRLAPLDGRWRLQGRLKIGEHAVRLAPALGIE
jgi:hypothetical protein